VRYTLRVSRFAIREATLGDAEGIARAHTASWQTSYRGILPDSVLDLIDVGQRASSRRQILRDHTIYKLVAYETTRNDVVGFCDAGASRQPGPWAGEIYAIYLEHHAKRHGLGREMFDQATAWLRGHGMPSMVIWVLENNPHARRFYEAMGGRSSIRMQSRVGGFPVTELAYVWDRI
jgi:ribosomal protein S18 acetylase RimI-like enzyme